MRRRDVIKGAFAGGLGLAAAAVIGCDDDGGSAPTATPEGTSTPQATSRATAEPTAKFLNQDLLELNDPDAPFPYVLGEPDLPPQKGGIFRYGTRFKVGATVDPARGSTVSIIGPAGPSMDRLVEMEANQLPRRI